MAMRAVAKVGHCLMQRLFTNLILHCRDDALELIAAELREVAKAEDRLVQHRFTSPTLHCRDVAPELEKLRVRAVGKARDCLMQRIYSLRKPKTNIQILQQNVLLKCKYLVTFLRLHGREVFTEVRAAYVDTLSRVLSSHFRAYLAAIDRLKVGRGARCSCMLSGHIWRPSTASGSYIAGSAGINCLGLMHCRVCGH